jgi:hypothetical protein
MYSCICFLFAIMADASAGSRYYFHNVGSVRELVYPNKAILVFRLHGKEEKAILLAKTLTLDGKAPDEHKNLDNFLKCGDVVSFDCHIYDKGGGVGSGKDRQVSMHVCGGGSNLSDSPSCHFANPLILVLGRVNDSSSHDSILFVFIAGERVDSSLLHGLASRGSARFLVRKGQNDPKSA